MIERFDSNDYNGEISALCDEIYLPFWKIHASFECKNAIPFVYYILNDGNSYLEIGKNGYTHDDIFEDSLKNVVERYENNVLCGRIWDFYNKKIITIWTEGTQRYMMSSNCFKDILKKFKSRHIDIGNAELIFEAYKDFAIKQFTSSYDDIEDGYYIYTIPIAEYISNNCSNLNDVVRLYDIQEKKRRLNKPKNRWSNFDYKDNDIGYLGYHLMTRQDEGKKQINENILLDKLPETITNSLLNSTTSLGNNPAIPDIYDIPFLVKLSNNRFSEIKKSLKDIGTIDDFEDTDINSMLSKLIIKCKEIERPHRNELEKLCVNYVIDTFNVPEDSVQLNVSLVDEVDLNNRTMIVDPIDSDDDFEYDDIDSMSNIRGEIYKRKILNALCMGEALILSSNIDSYYNSISKISPELCNLYLKIIELNNYSLYLNDDIEINDRDKKQIGTVNVELGNENEQVRITAQGEIFPVLLSETLRGFMELFISHGLPINKKMAEIVIGKSDYLKAEPWNMRLGPSLWILLTKSFNDITLHDLPYLLKRIASLDVDKFNYLMKEVFAKTKKGRIIMSKICNKAKKDIEYNKFTDKMSKMNLDKSIITDEFINEYEL